MTCVSGGDTPNEITVRATGDAIDLTLTFSVAERVRTRLSMIQIAATTAPMDFLQLGGVYRVAGRAGGRTIEFTARGAAETFRPSS